MKGLLVNTFVQIRRPRNSDNEQEKKKEKRKKT